MTDTIPLKALKCVFRAVEHRHQGITFDQFSEAFTGWNIRPIEFGGEIIGGVLQNGSEVHLAIEPTWQNKVWLRGITKDILLDVVNHYGKATTKVASNFGLGHRLARLIGFNKTSEHDGITEYELIGVKLD